jgi:L-asparaginase II
VADAYAGGEPLAEVIRSGFVEGRHHGSVAVLGPDGVLVEEAGDAGSPILPRSSSKPLQAVGMLRAGLRLTDPADLAQACASHHGEPMHVTRVRAMLAAGGFSEADLSCPPDYPLSEPARIAVIRAGGDKAAVLMNCSGKHAAMLLTCRANDWPTGGYLDPAHPLQQALAGTIADLAGEPITAVGVDGCGAPVFALSLRGLAAAFLRLVSASPASFWAERSVSDAMRAHPECVSGTGDDAHDTRLMRGVPGLLSKGGAEGVLAVAVPGVGAVALKIDDGAMRARIPVLASALRRLALDAPIVDRLAAEEKVRGGGRPVGIVRALW